MLAVLTAVLSLLKRLLAAVLDMTGVSSRRTRRLSGLIMPQIRPETVIFHRLPDHLERYVRSASIETGINVTSVNSKSQLNSEARVVSKENKVIEKGDAVCISGASSIFKVLLVEGEWAIIKGHGEVGIVRTEPVSSLVHASDAEIERVFGKKMKEYKQKTLDYISMYKSERNKYRKLLKKIEVKSGDVSSLVKDLC